MTHHREPEASLSPTRYNEALNHPTVRAVLRQLAVRDPRFRPRALIEHIGGLPRFPAISVGDLLSASAAAGTPLTGAHADPDELSDVPTPFLTFLKRGEKPGTKVDLVQVERIKRRRILILRDRFGEETITRDQLMARWTGVVMLPPAAGEALDTPSEADSYRAEISVLPGFLSAAECRELIDYCEKACFNRSRVMQRRGDDIGDVVMTRVRSSTSVVLSDRHHPILARLYARCAALEGVAPHHIESMQCVRYKRGQRFRPHFDGGVDLPRLTTFLLYLNDDFTGGETYFSMIDRSIAPLAGACLRFPSCDRAGRIIWQSEHGGLPVSSGVKYALNIWVRCPDVRVLRPALPATACTPIAAAAAQPGVRATAGRLADVHQ